MTKSLNKWRTQFTPYDSSNYAYRSDKPSRTVQSEKDLFNPNSVMKQYRRDRDKSVFERRKGIYADISGLSGMSSFSDVVSRMDSINELFMTLPALERERLGNDPMKFLDYVNNPANLEWLAKHGFVELSKKPDEIVETKSAVPLEQKTNSEAIKSSGTLEKSGV